MTPEQRTVIENYMTPERISDLTEGRFQYFYMKADELAAFYAAFQLASGTTITRLLNMIADREDMIAHMTAAGTDIAEELHRLKEVHLRCIDREKTEQFRELISDSQPTVPPEGEITSVNALRASEAGSRTPSPEAKLGTPQASAPGPGHAVVGGGSDPKPGVAS